MSVNETHSSADCGTPAERLAQGFIEATTEYDLAELPHLLRADLIACAEQFLAFAQPKVVAGQVMASAKTLGGTS